MREEELTTAEKILLFLLIFGFLVMVVFLIPSEQGDLVAHIIGSAGCFICFFSLVLIACRANDSTDDKNANMDEIDSDRGI